MKKLLLSQGKDMASKKRMPKILLVDDDPEYLGLLRNLLEQEGILVQCAASGEEAVAYLKQHTYNLLITDLNMPGLDGLSLARQAAAIAPDMSVIMITGSISPEVPRLAEEAGIVKVFPKTFDPDELLEKIAGWKERTDKVQL